MLLSDAGLSGCCLQRAQSWLQLVLFALGCSSLLASSGCPCQLRCRSSLRGFLCALHDQEPRCSQCSAGKTANTSYRSSLAAAVWTRSLKRPGPHCTESHPHFLICFIHLYPSCMCAPFLSWPSLWSTITARVRDARSG